jgi:hypothetical protein
MPSERTWAPGPIRQVNDLDTSTRYCPCGASFTWGDFGYAGLDPWMAIHAPHASGKMTSVDSEDGKRCLG